MDTAAEIVQAYWAAANDRNWPAFGDLLANDVVYEGPQARERVRGRDAYLRFNAEGFPGDWHLEVARVVGDGSHAASWIQMTNADGTVQPGVCFFDLDERGRITHIVDLWPEPTPYRLSGSGSSSATDQRSIGFAVTSDDGHPRRGEQRGHL